MGKRSIRVSRLRIVAFCILLTLPPTPHSVAFGQNSGEELRQDIAQLDSFLSNQNLDSIEVTVNRESAKWREKDRPSYIVYMTKACSLLSSYDIGDVPKRGLLQSHYAISVLTSGDLTLEEQVRFVEFITFIPFTIDETAWNSLRKQTAELSLSVWHRVSASVDLAFDFNDRPLLNVQTPQASGVPSGASPESIKDLKLRAEYERAIVQNSAKARRYNDQYWLKQTAPDFYKSVEKYLVHAYSRPPADSAQLERLLSQYVDDNDVRARILAEVRKVGLQQE